MKQSVYIQVCFGSKRSDLVWVWGKLIRPEQRNNKQRHYQPDPVSKDNLLPAETQLRTNYPQSVTRSPSSLDVLTTKKKNKQTLDFKKKRKFSFFFVDLKKKLEVNAVTSTQPRRPLVEGRSQSGQERRKEGSKEKWWKRAEIPRDRETKVRR